MGQLSTRANGHLDVVDLGAVATVVGDPEGVSDSVEDDHCMLVGDVFGRAQFCQVEVQSVRFGLVPTDCHAALADLQRRLAGLS